MKLNKKKLKTIKLIAIGGEIKDEDEFRYALFHCIEKIKRGQSSRKENTLNEVWGVEDLEQLINCIEVKEK